MSNKRRNNYDSSKIRVWEILEKAKPGDRVSRIFDISIISLISLNIVAIIVESIALVQAQLGPIFEAFEVFSVSIFSIEYTARIWSCTTDSRYRGSFSGRIKYALTPMAIFDLVAILPFFLQLTSSDLRFARALRLLRIFRVAKLGRYVEAFQLLNKVFKSKREELLLTIALMFLLLVMSSCFMYFAEHAAQPKAFPNIPSTVWWAVSTVTTVGYGDVYPITSLGRILASIVSILGIGFFALPTSVLGSAFVEEMQKARRPSRCPHCGTSLE